MQVRACECMHCAMQMIDDPCHVSGWAILQKTKFVPKLLVLTLNNLLSCILAQGLLFFPPIFLVIGDAI